MHLCATLEAYFVAYFLNISFGVHGGSTAIRVTGPLSGSESSSGCTGNDRGLTSAQLTCRRPLRWSKNQFTSQAFSRGRHALTARRRSGSDAARNDLVTSYYYLSNPAIHFWKCWQGASFRSEASKALVDWCESGRMNM